MIATSKPARNPKVAIIGAGMTGILWAIRLQEAGIEDFEIFEKADDVGGTWRENTYPGVACDVPAHMYVYSFELNPDWSSRVAPGAEIWEYFRRVSAKYGVTRRIRFNEEVTACEYTDGKWHVQTSKGKSLVVDFVINCTGILHKPAFPAIEGLESFAGHKFHTAQWDHSVELKGKRIGIIGTGSTAAQVIPQLVKTAGTDVSVFQRTAQWILPFPYKDYSAKSRQRLHEHPWLTSLLFTAYSWAFRWVFSRFVIGRRLQKWFITTTAERNLEKSIRDPVLREKLRPNYPVGCKRLVINNDFYPAIQQPNAHLVTEGIEKIVPEGIVTRDGKLHELDVLVLSTGFDNFAFMRPMKLIGRDGLDINEAWANKARSYRSVFLPGFPNFFLMLGPNTPIGNNSVIAMSEVQTNYLMQVIERWRHGDFDTVEPKEPAIDAFMAHVKRGLPRTIWVTGCQSWYLDPDGDPALWPYTWEQWVREMKQPDYNDLVLKKLDPAPVRAAA